MTTAQKQPKLEWTRPYCGITYPQVKDAPLVSHASVIDRGTFAEAALYLRGTRAHYERVFSRRDCTDPVASAKTWLSRLLSQYRTGGKTRYLRAS